MGGCRGRPGVGRLLAQGERHKQTYWEGSLGAASCPCGSARPGQTRASPVLARGPQPVSWLRVAPPGLGVLWPVGRDTCGLWKRVVCVEDPARSLSLSVNFKSHGTIVSRLESAQTSGAQLGEVTCSALQTGEGDVPPALGLRPSTPSNPRLTVLLTSNTQHLFAASQLPTFGITQVRRWTWPGARAPA